MPRGTRYDPFSHAHSLGLHLIEHPLPDGACARYFGAERTIIICPDLSEARKRSAVAHEVQHALRGDSECGGPGDESPAEMEIRVATARKLVNLADVAVARWISGSDPEALAKSLNISMSVMRDWLEFVAPTVGVRDVA